MDVKLPKTLDLLLPTLKAIQRLGGSGSRSEICDNVSREGGFDEQVLTALNSSGKQVIPYRVGWALTGLKKAGALDNSERGIWSITAAGKELLDQPAEGVRQMIIDVWKKFYAEREEDEIEPPTATIVEEQAEVAENWKDTLLKTLHGMRPDAFERLAQRVLRESNFTKVDVLGRSGDGGLDGVGILRVELLSFHVYFQCKRYRPDSSISSPQIRDFRGALQGRGEKGLFITTASFTADARREATRDGVIPIDLIDGDALCDLLKKLSLGVRTELVEAVQIDPDWFSNV